MFAVVTVGFVKDAAAHIDVQGFNVYHKNRLIKPFWRLWNTAGSDGRGVIGVLEANFVEPAHDKQGFERTTVLARLENKLVHMQRTYWRNYCHKIGYAPRYNKEPVGCGGQESLAEYTPLSSNAKKKGNTKDWDRFNSCSSLKQGGKTARKYVSVNEKYGNGLADHGRDIESSEKLLSPSTNDYEQDNIAGGRVNGINHPTRETPQKVVYETTCHSRKSNGVTQQEVSITVGVDTLSLSDLHALNQLQKENHELKERLEREEGEMLGDLLRDLQNEKDKRKVLEIKLQEADHKIEELNREQETLIDIFTDERDRRDLEEEILRKRLRDVSNTIEGLHEKVRLLEKMKLRNGK